MKDETRTINLTDTELAKNWDYLGSIHVVYMMLIESMAQYTRSLVLPVRSESALADLKSKLHSATMMAYNQFKKYLDNNKEQLGVEFKDYENVWQKDKNNPEELLKMCYILINWYQAYGYFKLENQKEDPHLALQNG